MWRIGFSMTSCLYYWSLRGKHIVHTFRLFELHAFSGPIKSFSHSKQYIYFNTNSYFYNSVLIIFFCLLILLIFCYTINRHFGNKNIYMFLSLYILIVFYPYKWKSYHPMASQYISLASQHMLLITTRVR